MRVKNARPRVERAHHVPGVKTLNPKTPYEQCEPWIIVHIEYTSMRVLPRCRMEQTESFNWIACLIR